MPSTLWRAAHDVSREQDETFRSAQRAFARAARLGHPRPGGSQFPIEFPVLDHQADYTVDRRPAAVASWPWVPPDELHERLAALSARYAHAVVGGDHPAARVFRCGVSALVVADRETGDADAITELFAGASWATRYATAQDRLTERLDELNRRRR